MKCPTCNIPLLISERQGIEIDYCQQCRGVWLDRGELDKLIERAGPSHPVHKSSNENYSSHSSSSNHGGFPMGHKRERENPIGELFDFF